ncbi:MAG: hypothetical protein JJU35_13335 [Balneolales bacterium]|nr:hypothetical protein [Balneolales bacterium]
MQSLLTSFITTTILTFLFISLPADAEAQHRDQQVWRDNPPAQPMNNPGPPKRPSAAGSVCCLRPAGPTPLTVCAGSRIKPVKLNDHSSAAQNHSSCCNGNMLKAQADPPADQTQVGTAYGDFNSVETVD